MGRGGRGGMVLFGAISIMPAMIVRVIWRVRECFCWVKKEFLCVGETEYGVCFVDTHDELVRIFAA
jgi:hypothetical protein